MTRSRCCEHEDEQLLLPYHILSYPILSISAVPSSFVYLKLPTELEMRDLRDLRDFRKKGRCRIRDGCI